MVVCCRIYNSSFFFNYFLDFYFLKKFYFIYLFASLHFILFVSLFYWCAYLLCVYDFDLEFTIIGIKFIQRKGCQEESRGDIAPASAPGGEASARSSH